MSIPPQPEPITSAPTPALATDAMPLPPLRHKVVMVVDLVESVRLMAVNEADVVNRWRGFVQHASTQVLPAHAGRLVKSLGDGMLIEFEHPAQAVRAALALHRYFDPLNKTLPLAQQMHMRAGINASQLYVDENDVYGHGVNLAARVADLAAPGETVVTASVYDGIVAGVDADVQDRGESYLKHWPEPVRTWVVTPLNAQAPMPRLTAPDGVASDFRPAIAVVPFETRSHAAEQFVIGDLIADGVIAQLSRSQDLRVISRLSTNAFRGRSETAVVVGQQLRAGFTLSGSYVTYADTVVIMAELTDNQRGEVVWAERLSGDTMDLLQSESTLIQQLSEVCAQALLHTVVQRTLVLPVPQLDSNALMLGGITLMHRSTPRDLQRSHQLLEAVVERHKRVATPWAWLAKWHVMQVVQGLAPEPARAFREAIGVADRALDLDPNSSLAMAIKGHAMCHLGDDVEGSRRLLQEATQSNPSDAMAWLYSSVWSTMWGTGQDSIDEAENALRLSPLDPQRYYFELILSTCLAASGDWARAVELGRSSLRKNGYHAPTIRALLVAEYEHGDIDAARSTFKRLLALQPDLTVEKYLSSGGQSPLRQRVARVMGELGMKLH